MSAKLLVIYGFAAFHTLVMLMMAVTHYRQMRRGETAERGLELMFPSVPMGGQGRQHRVRMWVYLGAASLSIAVSLLVYVFLHGRI